MPPPPPLRAAAGSDLDSFLGSIGAHQLDPRLDPARPRRAEHLGDQIQLEIDSVNDSTLALLRAESDTFHDELTRGRNVLRDVARDDAELAALEREVDPADAACPDAFLSPLVDHLEQHRAVATDHAHASHVVTLVTALDQLHSAVEALADATTAGTLYPTAVEHLRHSAHLVERGAQDWIEDTDPWRLLVRWHADELARLDQTLQLALQLAFDFDTTSTTTRLTLSSHAKAHPDGPRIELEDVLRALDDLGRITGEQSAVERLVATVSKHVLRNFVAPFLDANGTTTWPDDLGGAVVERTLPKRLAFSYPPPPDAEVDGPRTVILGPVPADGDDAASQTDPIAELAHFLAFFTTHCPLFAPSPSPSPSPSRYTALLTASLTPSIQSYVITSHLVPSLPAATRHLAQYLALVARATTFESTKLPELNLFAFLPSSAPVGVGAAEEAHIVSTWAESVPHHWARAVGATALASVRNLVQTWDWANPDGGELVAVEVREDEEMEGLLRGLELGLVDDDLGGGGRGGQNHQPVVDDQDGEKEKKTTRRRTELETVPKGAKREMTLEEALAPRPPRAVTPPPPPPPPPIRPVSPPGAGPSSGSVGGGGGRKSKLKLGAAKISKGNDHPRAPSSPSPPPPMFRGDDLPVAVEVPPISTSTTPSLLDPLASQPQHHRSDSNHHRGGGAGSGEGEGEGGGGGLGTPILSPRPISIPSAASFTHAAADQDDDDDDDGEAGVHAVVERAQRTIAESGTDLFEPLEPVRPEGVEMLVPTAKAADDEIVVKLERDDDDDREQARADEPGLLTPRALEQLRDNEDEKPFIKRDEDDDDGDDARLTGVTVEIVEPDVTIVDAIKREEEEPDEEEEEEAVVVVKEEELSTELETTPQIGDFEPTPQPPPFYYARKDGSSPLVGLHSRADHDGDDDDDPLARVDDSARARPVQQSAALFPPPDDDDDDEEVGRDGAPAPFSPPPPEEPTSPACLPTTPAPPPPPPPPRAGRAVPISHGYAAPPPPPRSQRGVLSPPVLAPPRQSARPISPVAAPLPPRQGQGGSNQPRRVLSPPAAAAPPRPKSPLPYAPPPPRGPVRASPATTAGPPPPPPPPPPRSGLSPVPPPPQQQHAVGPPPPPSSRGSRPYPRQSTVPPVLPPAAAAAPLTSPFGGGGGGRPPSRTTTTATSDGPVLNHIQQRFVSPPPSHVNPYPSFPVPAPSSSSSSSYLPANDPLLADLFGSSSSSKPARADTKAASYFAPDPPAQQQQRSNSTTLSQGGGGAYAPPRPESRGSSSHNRPHQQQQQYYASPSSSYPHPYFDQQGYYYGTPSANNNEVEELAGGIGGGYDHLHDAMRLRGGASLELGDMDDDDTGNQSGDDWGFGEGVDVGEGEDEDDAWGFGNDDDDGGGGGDEEELAPSPPPPSPPPPPVVVAPPPLKASPVRVVPAATVLLAPTSSASVTSSHAASSGSRPVRAPSYAFPASLAPSSGSNRHDLADDDDGVGRARIEQEVDEDEDEAGDDGDDAWGFDATLDDNEDENENEAESPPPPPPPPPPAPEAPFDSPSEVVLPLTESQEGPASTSTRRVVHQVVVEPGDVLPPITLGADVPQEEDDAFPEEPLDDGPADDAWGLDDAAAAEAPPAEELEETATEPSVELPLAAALVANAGERDERTIAGERDEPVLPVSLLERREPRKESRHVSEVGRLLAAEDLSTEKAPSETRPAALVAPPHDDHQGASEADPSEATLDLGMTTVAAEGPIVVNAVELEPVPVRESSPEPVPVSHHDPIETPAFDEAEEGHPDAAAVADEESGWGLDDDEEQVPVSEEEVDEPAPAVPAATPALDVAEEGGHSVVAAAVAGEVSGAQDAPSLREVPPTTIEETSPLEEEEEAPTLARLDGDDDDDETPALLFPTATPALDDAEIGLAPALDPASTGLERTRPSREDEDDEAILPASTPALELAEDGQSVRVAVDDADAWDFEEGEDDEALSRDPNLLESHDEPQAGEEALTRVGSASIPTDRAARDEETVEVSVSEQAAPKEEEEEAEPEPAEEPVSALTAPAEDLRDEAFPRPTTAESVPEDDARAGSDDEEQSLAASTATLPEPLAHSDRAEASHVAHDASEERVLEAISASVADDDAQILDLVLGPAGTGTGAEETRDDPWGIEPVLPSRDDGQDAVAVAVDSDSGLTRLEAFAPDLRASEREARALPVEGTLFDATPPLSPPHSDTVLVEPMSSSNSSRGTAAGDRAMSSPEVIEKSDAWGFDLEEEEEGGRAQPEPGAEILDDERPEPEEEEEEQDESVVQHEAERPILHEDSSVQHVDERPLVASTAPPDDHAELELAATTAHPQDHTWSPAVDSLPDARAEPSTWSGEPRPELEQLDAAAAIDDARVDAERPISRSASPSPAAAAGSSPRRIAEDDTTADDPWDLDLEDVADGADTAELAEAIADPDAGRPETPQSGAAGSSLDAVVDAPAAPEESAPEPVDDVPDSSSSPTTTTGADARPVTPELEQREPSTRGVADEDEDEDDEEEGWGWDESADAETSREPLPEPGQADSRRVEDDLEDDRTSNVAEGSLVEAAGAISALAAGAAAAIGLSSADRPQAPSSIDEGPSAASEAGPPHRVAEQAPVSHDRKPSAEGWGWDGVEEESDDAPVPPRGVVDDGQVEDARHDDAPRAPAAPPARMEKMMVSRRSREIVKIAEDILVEALTVASPSFEHVEFSAASAPLLSTFVSLLSLYRATAAVHNSTLLASVPAIGMQFANDADWIGREVERVWRSNTTGGRQLSIAPSQVSEVETAIEATRQLGRDTRQKQIAIQRGALMESLDEAAGFLRTSDDARYATCERALQQVTHTLQRLALVWKPVMTPTALYTTLGGLVNEVLLRVLDEIEDQTDISEDESIRLNRLCKMLHALESLFDGSETSVGREVPIWFKFVFLSELLEASMADILFLFDHGHLVDFSPQEIVRLIRALFSDSPLRNRNVEKILAGHPTVTPEDEEDEWAPAF
ncbi:hypothetical protein JCM11491_002356 [Sporobolomyces phaffii]